MQSNVDVRFLTPCGFSKIGISDLVAAHKTRNELAHSDRVGGTARKVIDSLLCTLVMKHELP